MVTAEHEHRAAVGRGHDLARAADRLRRLAVAGVGLLGGLLVLLVEVLRPVERVVTLGSWYMTNAGSAANPGDPPPTFTSITAYRVQIVDDADTPTDQGVKLVVL